MPEMTAPVLLEDPRQRAQIFHMGMVEIHLLRQRLRDLHDAPKSPSQIAATSPPATPIGELPEAEVVAGERPTKKQLAGGRNSSNTPLKVVMKHNLPRK